MYILRDEDYTKMFNRFWDNITAPTRTNLPGDWKTMQIPTNTAKKDGKYYVFMELPGFKREDIEISFENNSLEVVAKREIEDKNLISQHFFSENLKKVLDFKEQIDYDGITSELKHGILEIVLPSKDKDIKKITIK